MTSTTVFLGKPQSRAGERTRLEAQLDRAHRVLAAIDAASGQADSDAEAN